MITRWTEATESDFQGTIIDVETIGGFRDEYPDSRRYQDHRLVIVGFIEKYHLEIVCARGDDSIAELVAEAQGLIAGLERPFCAFNSGFERGVFFYNLGMKISFERELQRGRESKEKACRQLTIPHYDDPFFGRGADCMDAWRTGRFDQAVAHNRACLLKERDILLKRGFGEPEPLRFVKL